MQSADAVTCNDEMIL